MEHKRQQVAEIVSVPIRGLFNLTMLEHEYFKKGELEFPSPLGDYLI